MRQLFPVLFGLLLAPVVAHAADEPKDAPIDEGDFDDTKGPGLKLDDEDDVGQSVKPRGPGEDTAELYRAAQEKAKDLSEIDEITLWEGYLKKYPDALFKKRIEQRLDDLERGLYAARTPGLTAGPTAVDAGRRELNLAVPLQFTNVDPRTRARAKVELGIPNWSTLDAEFEYALRRELSVRAAMSKDLTNRAINAGVKYAVIKSARTGSLVTGGADLKAFTDPGFFGLHPWVGGGQRFDVLGGLDVQGSVGTDLEFRAPFGPRLEANLAAELQASPVVGIFLETSNDLKPWSYEDRILMPDGTLQDATERKQMRFFVGTFGMRFMAVKPKDDSGRGRVNVALAANVPYSSNYWGFYEGAVSLAADWYL
ncbi:MAG: hypothetical protein RLZZ299_2814 [Pseudomonadota bacterium]